MAGILVSGGTYSGSGDLTTDWVKIKNVAGGWFIAPEGDLTLISQTGGYSIQASLPTGATAGFHSNGGTVVFAADGSNPLIDVDGFNGMGHFYNVQATLATTRYHTRIKASGNLTIDAGATFESSRVPYTTNNTYVDFDGHALITGTYNAEGLSSDGTGDTFGSLTIASAGTFDACSGTTTLNDILGTTQAELGSYIYDNGGSFVHNSGTLAVDSLTAGALIIRPNVGNGNLYNLSTSRSTGQVLYWGTPGMIIENDLSISATTMYPGGVSYDMTVSGAVTLVEGAAPYDAQMGATNTAGDYEFGALIMESGSTMYGSAGTITIDATSRFDGSASVLCWSLSTGGTFTHNDGTVKFQCAGGATPVDQSLFFSPNTGSFYDLEVQVPEGRYLYMQSGDDLLVDNDLTIETPPAGGAVGTLGRWGTTTGVIVVSGTATIEDQGKIRWGADNPSNYGCTFGALVIQSGGEYEATTGITKLFGKTGVTYQQTGTFTHNGGLFWVSGGTQQMAWGNTLHGPFYDLKSSGENIEIRGKALKVENSFIIESGYVLPTYAAGTGKIWTFGTASSSAYISGTAEDPLKVNDSGSPYHFVVQASSSLYPVELKGYEWLWAPFGTAQSIKFGGVNCQFNINTDNGGTIANTFKLIGQCEFDAVNIEENTIFNCSGQRVTFGGTMTTAADGLIVSGALVEMTGAGNWTEGGYQQYQGRPTASIIWNSTGIYNPNGGYLFGWKNVLWNADARVNQDLVFRGTNLIVAASFDANNRVVGTSGSPTQVVIANGGTVSSSTKTINASSFSNRGGLFASSSAVTFDGTTSYIQVPHDSTLDPATTDTFTWEVWMKSSEDANNLTGRFIDMGGGGPVFLGMNDSDNADYIYEAYFNVYDGVGNNYARGTTKINDGKWHHIAGVLESNKTTMNLYVDGKLEGTEECVGTGIPASANPNIEIGRYDSGNYFDGELAMIRIFSDARTPAELRTDMFNQHSDMDDTGNLIMMQQFDTGEGTTIYDSANSHNGTMTDTSWSTGGTWTAGNKLGADGAEIPGNLYIGNLGASATIFASSYFPIANRSLISGSKFASKAHGGTLEYYIATSGTDDWLSYQKLASAPIGTHNDVKIIPPAIGTTQSSYFSFDNSADNEQCNTLVNYGGSYVRILTNEDFYTQDFDNQGTWIRNSTYDGIIHDDGSTPHEYNPIDIMDDQDSGFDAEDLID